MPNSTLKIVLVEKKESPKNSISISITILPYNISYLQMKYRSKIVHYIESQKCCIKHQHNLNKMMTNEKSRNHPRMLLICIPGQGEILQFVLTSFMCTVAYAVYSVQVVYKSVCTAIVYIRLQPR